jgi:N-acetylglucosaminyldiphosphoundecaprenol N-acetyl-beta-D-mannosaminyltransferase
MLNRKTIFDFPIHIGTYKDFLREIIQLAASGTNSYVCVANVHVLIEAYRNPSYASISRNADLVAPDGMPLTWALRLLYNIRQERVAGMDLLPDLLKEAEIKEVPVFFYGGTEQMLSSTKIHIAKKYPGLTLSGLYSPPFRQLTEVENDNICDIINTSGAKLIFVALGCPKQEKWMASMKGKVNATMIGIGAAVPVMVKQRKRAPKWMQKNGLEWMYRVVQEPRRLWKRYLLTNSMFIYLLLKEELRLKSRNFFC